MSYPSRSSEWESVRAVEDVLALLVRVDEHRKVIRAHAWNEASFEQIYVEATEMQAVLGRLKDLLSEKWRELHTKAQGGQDDE